MIQTSKSKNIRADCKTEDNLTVQNNARSNMNKHEREQLLFGFNPATVMKDITCCVEDYLCDGFDDLEKRLISSLPNTKNSNQIQHNIDKIWEKMTENVLHNMGNFELYALENIFQIPNDIMIPGEFYGTSTPKYSQEDLECTEKEINSLRKELYLSSRKQKMLKKELYLFKTELNEYKKLINSPNIAQTVDKSLANANIHQRVDCQSEQLLEYGQPQLMVDLQEAVTQSIIFNNESKKLKMLISEYSKKRPINLDRIGKQKTHQNNKRRRSRRWLETNKKKDKESFQRHRDRVAFYPSR